MTDDDRLANLRPRLRNDVIYADTGDGVLLRDSDTGFVLKGKLAYRWARTVIPYLSGEQTLAALCDGLPDEHRVVVFNMVGALLDRGLLRDVQAAGDGELPEPVLEYFRPQINYVDHYADHPKRRFARFRASRVLVLGAGYAATMTAAALLRNGVRRVDLGPEVGAADMSQAGLAEQALALTRDGCPASVHTFDHAPADLTAEHLMPFDVVLVVTGFDDGFTAARIEEMTSLCAAGGPILLPVAIVGRHVVLGPMVRPDAAPCWMCAALRLSANIQPATAATLWREIAVPGFPGSAAKPGGPVAGMLGNALAFDVFRLRTGCVQAETDDAIVVQDLDTLESVRERLLPHPLCPRCQDRPSVAVARPPVENTSQVDRQTPLFGRFTGVISEFGDGSLSQSPLKVARIRLGSAGRSGGARQITAFDLHTLAQARERALDAVVLTYADEIADIRHAVTDPAVGVLRRVAPHELLNWNGLPAADDVPPPGLPARALVAGEDCLVPAAAVYPFATINQPHVFEPTSGGTGCGATTAEASEAALVSAFGYQALRAAASGLSQAVVLDPDAFAGDPEIEFLLRTLEDLDCAVRLLDLPGGRPAHAVLAVAMRGDAETHEWAVGAELSAHAAMIAALRDLIGRIQVRREHHPPDAIDLGNPLLPEFHPLVVRAAQPATQAGRDGRPATVADLIDKLRSERREAFAVDTTPADLQATGLFATTRVLLTHSPSS